MENVSTFAIISYSWYHVACVAGGFKGLGVYGEGNYGERNEKDVYNILRRRREKLGTRRGEEENAGEKFPPAPYMYKLSHE